MVAPGKKRLVYLSWITLVGMGTLGALLVIYTQKANIALVLNGHKNQYFQVLAGLFFGSLSSLMGILLINGKRFNGVRTFFENLMRSINPNLGEILFYSFCAAVGEEMLFRAGIQPIIKVWPTAVLFVALHGYLNPGNLSLTIYGVFLVAISAGFGYLFQFIGITSCIVAHFVYDVSMFSLLKYSYRKSSEAMNTQAAQPQ